MKSSEYIFQLMTGRSLNDIKIKYLTNLRYLEVYKIAILYVKITYSSILYINQYYYSISGLIYIFILLNQANLT